MTAGEATVLIGAVVGGLATLAGAVVTLVKGWQFWRKGSVQILTGYIERVGRELEVTKLHLVQKQEAIDELFGLHFECEVREADYYGWMERAVERMTREGEKLREKGIEPEPPLQMPPKRDKDRGKKYAAYLRRRAKHNTEMAAMVADKLASDAPGGGDGPKTY